MSDKSEERVLKTTHRLITHRFLKRAGTALVISLLFASVMEARDRDDWAKDLRQFIDQQVGINNLKVPATDAEIPVPAPNPGSGNTPYRYQTTEAKRYLGKLLFHDPVRTARIDTKYGGVRATAQTGSCDSCHIGEASGKAGQQLNFNVGGEGRGYFDESGNFIPRRRPRTDILPQMRTTPLFPGDALVDFLPTLTDEEYLPNLPPSAPCPSTDVYIGTPARDHETPAPCAVPGTGRSVFATGRLDALDSVGRQSPSMVGFAYNNRLLLGGFAGEPITNPGGLNPNNDPAQENLTLLLLDAHRMFTDLPATPGESPAGEETLNGQMPVLQNIPAFVKLFKDAFPVEAANYASSGNINDLVSDDTVLRATSTYLRTAVTRNTPFDRFLAGDNSALTENQMRGAKLFFTPAAGGAGGAGCFACHSGPMFNRQSNDPDLAGIGQLVEENFVNVGIGDHPLQALNRAARNDPNFHDVGRMEITGDPNANFKFRVVTLRQLKEAFTFFHSGDLRFASVTDVVEYFNAGVPQDLTAGAASTLDPRFTNPRGPGYPAGLGLTEDQVDALTDFLENGLYDPAFSHYDPKSPTRLFELDPTELQYSKYHPELTALGAKDGFPLSGLALNDNDPLSRRDQGLEFLNVTNKLGVEVTRNIHGQEETETYTISNISTASDVSGIVDTNLLIIVQGLTKNVRLENASGISSSGNPYLRVFLPNGVLNPGQSIVKQLTFDRSQCSSKTISYTLNFLSGQGKP